MDQQEIDKRLMEMCNDLGLPEVGQDWGITYSDPNRMTEFISYYQSKEFIPLQKEYLMELILQSANELILENCPAEEIEKFERFYAKHYHKAPMQHRYWSRLSNDDGEFPIAEICKNY